MAIFDHEKVYIVKNGLVILHGNINPNTGYIVNLRTELANTQPQLDIDHMVNIGAVNAFTNKAYKIKVKDRLVEYYQRCCFSPVI